MSTYKNKEDFEEQRSSLMGIAEAMAMSARDAHTRTASPAISAAVARAPAGYLSRSMQAADGGLSYVVAP